MLAQLECPRGQTQALHRQRLVLVLLALVLYRHRLVLVLLAAPPTADAACAGAPPRPAAKRQHAEVSLSRVVDASGLASWVLYRQRLVLELLAPAPGQCLVQRTAHCCSQRQRLAHLLQCCYHRQRLVHCC